MKLASKMSLNLNSMARLHPLSHLPQELHSVTNAAMFEHSIFFGTFCVALKQFPEKQSLCSFIKYKIINKIERKSDLDLMRISFMRVVFVLFTCRAKTSPEPEKLDYGKAEEECHT